MTSLLALAIALVFGLLSTRLMKLIKLPNVTGFLLAGLLIGPYCFNIVTADFVRNYEVIIDVALGFIAFSIGAEFPSSPMVETAEQFVIFQTEHLDPHDQALHAADKQVAQDNDDPVGAPSGLGACQHEHHFHHGRVAYCKSAYTDEGKGVGEVA